MNFNIANNEYALSGRSLNPITWPYNATSNFKLSLTQQSNSILASLTRGASLTSIVVNPRPSGHRMTGFRLYCGTTENGQIQNALLANNIILYREVTPNPTTTPTPTPTQSGTPTPTPSPSPTPTPTNTAQPGTYGDVAENYGSSWPNSSNFGTGMNPWILYRSPTVSLSAGFSIKNPTTFSYSGLGTSAWTLTGFYTDYANAERALTLPLDPGDMFEINLGANFRATGAKGITIFTNNSFANQNALLNFNVAGDNYVLSGRNLNPATWPYSATANFKLRIQQQANSILATLTRGAALTSITVNPQNNGFRMTGFRLYCGGTENGQMPNALLSNNIGIYRQVTPAPTVTPTFTPSPTPSPTPSGTVTPTPSPSPTASPTPSPTPTLTPGSFGDNASNYVSWTNNSNAGSNLRPWTLYTSPSPTVSAGFSVKDGVLAGYPNMGTSTWTITGYNTAYGNAERLLTYSLDQGDTFEITVAANFRNGAKGISFFTNGTFNSIDELVNFQISNDSYTLSGLPLNTTTWNYVSSSEFKFSLRQQSNSILLSLTRGAALTAITVNPRPNGSKLTGFRMYCGGTENAQIQNALLANSIIMYNDVTPLPTSTPTPTPTIAIGQDNATSSAYSDGFQDGDNGGSGFTSWQLIESGTNLANSGVSIGDSTVGAGNINTSSISFAAFAHKNNTPANTAYLDLNRNIPVALTAGYALSAAVSVNFRNGAKGLVLFADTNQTTQIYAFSVESDQYRINNVNKSAWLYSATSIFEIIAKQTTATTVEVTTRRRGLADAPDVQTFIGTVNSLRLFANNTENNLAQNNLYFNSLKVYQY